ncbi:MAG: coproporphyrinogen dehydrogenase HemZ [Blautia sp.]|nr:coproporphyrinogen dehydrogenase HemZ [Blautia sp.]
MIYVFFDRPDFEYDVHSLVKAFFPKEDVALYYTCPEEEVVGKNVACMHRTAGDLTEEEIAAAGHILEVAYGGSEISLYWRCLSGAACGGAAHGASPEEERHVCFPVCADRGATKNALKQQLYGMLAEYCGKDLPWGTLTGIRPTKLAMKLLEEGKGEAEIASSMKSSYLVSDEKLRLAIDIAKREKALLDPLDYENGYSLYIGIPFCPSTCLYCSFTSYPLAAWRGRVDDYLDALEREIDFAAAKLYHKKLNSVYIGGGTPTTLEPYQLDRLLRKLECSFDFKHCLEFTVEAGRPDSITRKKLAVLRRHGITRISINPQTMKQETLDLIGRHHTVEQTIKSFQLARELGFDNINMDLILGLPEETLDDVRNTMEALTKLAPDNITVHSLAVKRAARLNIWKERYEKMQMVNTQEHMELCARYCEQMGLFPYYLYRQKGMAGNMENVGYAKPGMAGVYNVLIMEEVQTIVALGAGSITKRVYPDGTIKRCENVKDVAQYITRIDEMIERKRVLLSD